MLFIRCWNKSQLFWINTEMRHLIKIIESYQTLTPFLLGKSIQEKVEKYISEGIAKSSYDIDNGFCDQFANEIINDFGGESSIFYAIEALNLCLDNDFNPRWDVRLIKSIFPKSHPTYGLTFKEIKYSIPSHTWIVFAGKHYDAECPEGIDNFFELPLIAKGMQHISGLK